MREERAVEGPYPGECEKQRSSRQETSSNYPTRPAIKRSRT